MVDLTDLVSKATAATSTMERRLRSIEANPNDSNRKRLQTLAEDRRRYELTIDALRKEAVQRIAAAKAEVAAAKAAGVERLRAVLGDVVLLRILERRIERMNEAQRRQAMSQAAPGWESEVLRLLCDVRDATADEVALSQAEKQMHHFEAAPWPVKWVQ